MLSTILTFIIVSFCQIQSGHLMSVLRHHLQKTVFIKCELQNTMTLLIIGLNNSDRFLKCLHWAEEVHGLGHKHDQSGLKSLT